MNTNPRDHVLPIPLVLRSDMTVLANVSCKVRVNGALTNGGQPYTSNTNPAIAQNADCPFGYLLKLPASTLNDGDVVEITALYNGAPVPGCYDVVLVVPAAVDGAHYTNARGDLLANLDAAISSRFRASDWVAPDNADIVSILADVVSIVSGLPTGVWEQLVPSHQADGSFGAAVAAIKAKTDLLGSVALTLISPTGTAGKLKLAAGADYKASDGLAVTWTGSWPTLSAVTLKIGSAFSVTGNAATPGVVSFDLTASQTAALPATADYSVWGTVAADGSKIRLAHGVCTVG